MKKGDSKKVPADGERWDCPRCGEPMQRWKHADDWKPQPGKSWFTHWFECMNKHCRTKQVMPKGACVKPGDDEPKGGAGSGGPEDGGPDPFGYEQLLCAEDIQRLAGDITIEGRKFWLSGWIKEGARGKFLSISARPADEKPTAEQRAASQRPTGGPAFGDEQIPFAAKGQQ